MMENENKKLIIYSEISAKMIAIFTILPFVIAFPFYEQLPNIVQEGAGVILFVWLCGIVFYFFSKKKELGTVRFEKDYVLVPTEKGEMSIGANDISKLTLYLIYSTGSNASKSKVTYEDIYKKEKDVLTASQADLSEFVRILEERFNQKIKKKRISIISWFFQTLLK